MEIMEEQFCDLLENVIKNRTNINVCMKHCGELFAFLEKAKNAGYDITTFKKFDLREEYKEDNECQKWFKEINELISVMIDKFESNCK